MIDGKLLRYVPKRLHSAIKELYRDEDGTWTVLYDGWIDDDMGGHVLHTTTIKEFREALKNVRRINELGE